MTMFTNHEETGAFPRLLFGRHQGYDLREQWISKGLLALAHAAHPSARARLFAFPDASDRFGLGPGMVQSMRYWLRATGLMIEARSSTRRGQKVPTLTPLGALLAQYDPYLERTGSLWLLHAHLAQNLLLAPTFYWFFQCFVGKTAFTKEACLEALRSWAIKDAPHQRIDPEQLRKDMECLFRLYAEAPQSPQMTPEPSVLTSPFRRLHMLRCLPPGTDGRGSTGRQMPRYHYTPHAEEIPALVVLALLLNQNPGMTRVPLTQVLYRQQQPGRSVGLTQTTLVDALHRLSRIDSAWTPRQMWMQQQPWLTLPTVPVEQVLLRYYTQP
ncbi:MAG TPA: DUF4007 family protein [Ktedonobacteraceae bacterium]|nr:DUF4007 family protein [Ktedonobacteraceae bacterium]